MPSVALPVARRRGPRRPALFEGVRAHLHAGTLDRRLISGEHPRHDPLLARRAAQLSAPRMRSALATGIERAVGSAHADSAGLSSQAPVDCQAVLAAEPELLALAARLRDGLPVSAAGVAEVRALLSDPLGPVFSGGGALQRRAVAALQALGHGVC
jgi:hypothetical protein